MVDFVDAFCGAGGASLGITRAGGRVVAAINHDPRAIWAHNANHPDVRHYNDDIRKIDADELAARIAADGHACHAIWWSAECTHLSHAKGGASRDADSRMLSEELPRFARALNPDWIFVENVREWLAAGPLRPRVVDASRRDAQVEEHLIQLQYELWDATAEGRAVPDVREAMDRCAAYLEGCDAYQLKGGRLVMYPDKPTAGTMYTRWVSHMIALGYRYEYRLINAADLGAHQSRLRYFGIFVKEELGLHPAWPAPTHDRDGAGGLPRWKACREILDMDDMGSSIFARKGKPLVAATLARIRHGLYKFGGTFIDRTHTGAAPVPVSEAMPTARANWSHYLVTAIDTRNFRNPVRPDTETIPTVMAQRDGYVLNAFLTQQYGASGAASIDRPLWAVTTSNHAALAVPFLVGQYGATKATAVAAPVGTLTANPKWSLNTAIIKYYGFEQGAHGVDEPLGTVTTRDRMAKVDFIASHHGGPRGHRRVLGMDRPLNTVGVYQDNAKISVALAADAGEWPYTLQHAPKPTRRGNLIHPAWCRVASGYLVDNRIIDIYYRMLNVRELKRAQGFPADYVLDPDSEKVAKKQIGNAVHTLCAEAIVLINTGEESPYHKQRKEKAMEQEKEFILYFKQDGASTIFKLEPLLGTQCYTIFYTFINTAIVRITVGSGLDFSTGWSRCEWSRFHAAVGKVTNKVAFTLAATMAGMQPPKEVTLEPVPPPVGHLNTCSHCGSSFVSKRSDAQHCTTRCRVAASRARKGATA